MIPPEQLWKGQFGTFLESVDPHFTWYLVRILYQLNRQWTHNLTGHTRGCNLSTSKCHVREKNINKPLCCVFTASSWLQSDGIWQHILLLYTVINITVDKWVIWSSSMSSSEFQSSLNTHAYRSLFSMLDAKVANAVIGLEFFNTYVMRFWSWQMNNINKLWGKSIGSKQECLKMAFLLQTPLAPLSVRAKILKRAPTIIQ